MIVSLVETLGGWQLLLITMIALKRTMLIILKRIMLIILKRIMLIILNVLITWFTHSLRIEAAPLSHSLSYLFEVIIILTLIVIIMITILVINIMMMTRYATRTASAASGT